MTPESVRDLLKYIKSANQELGLEDFKFSANRVIGLCESWLSMHEELERVKNEK